jgi:hypothetical protein
MQNSNRPRRLVKPFGALATSGYIRQVPVAAQSDGAASYDQGFPPETFQPVASGGFPPDGKDMNGVLFDATANAMAFAAGMPAMFDSTFANAIGGYPMYAVLASTTPGRFWQSTADGNAGNPDAGAGGWIAIIAPPGTTSGNYERRPSGILEQWGEVYAASTGEPVIGANMPVAFADGTYNVSLTPLLNGPSTAADTFVQIIGTSRTPTSFSVQYQRPATSGGSFRIDGFMWRAIGR